MESRPQRVWQSLSQLFHRERVLIPRAPRHSVETPVRYRGAGQADWSEGLTFNVSESGVIFRADRLLDVQSEVDMTFAVPHEITGIHGTVVVCRGRIVRTVLPATNDGHPHLAAKILAHLPLSESTGRS